ncbi:dnaJ homolog subfamily C member 16 isoform X1 [Hetaerina americana]|uniref:dnaJ homolog subfamily C member 16 isoform X1 n=1 Tax=Hetaerina americana TaxID=62018 RepID=UPI003A7F49EB
MKLYEFICFLLILALGVQGLGDPYKILGIRRSATVQEIRKAYKQLAKVWHPDKNKDPEAETKFVEITQAYELLSDPERRKQFDNFGVTEDPALQKKPDYSHYRRFDPLDDLFGFPGSGFRFHFQDRDITIFHKLSITTRAYENTIVPKSFKTPYLILFYSDWCFTCLQVEPIWKRIIEELEPIGLGIATVHSEHEPLLSRKVGVSGLPYLVMMMEGKPSHYKESLFSVQKVVEFVRSKFPYKLVQPVNDDNVDAFLNGWLDNRIRVLVFEKQEAVRLRYIMMAYYYRDRVAFGFVQLKVKGTEVTVKKYGVPFGTDTLLLFNENTERPVASLSMADIPVKTMQDIINNNKYLLLPRLSSQGMFDALCPPDAGRPRRRLCVVLVSQNTPIHEPARHALRQFAQDSPYGSDRVRFAYVFQERQPEFVGTLTNGQGTPAEPVLHVVIIWRRDTHHIKYEWLHGEWDVSRQQWNETRDQLEATIQRLLHASEALSYEAVVKELIDEHAQGVMTRIINKLLIMAEFLKDSVTKDQLLPAISVVATVLFIVAGGYVMSYLVRMEEESVQEQRRQNRNRKPKDGEAVPPEPSATPMFCQSQQTTSSNNSQLRLHELRAETYNGMVRLLKPGCRTVILLVDNDSRKKLLLAFHKIVWPYRKNKTLMFGYISLERGLDWYKRLLTLSLLEPRELNINPKNCIGTVLSLNGHRKYFCMYHAKHPECSKGKGSKRMVKMTKHFSNSEANAANGAFMGFDTSESDDTETSDLEQGDKQLEEEPLLDKYSNVVFQGNLLDGLPNWLDRLFEGSTHRYYVNYWPDFPPNHHNPQPQHADIEFEDVSPGD